MIRQISVKRGIFLGILLQGTVSMRNGPINT